LAWSAEVYLGLPQRICGRRPGTSAKGHLPAATIRCGPEPAGLGVRQLSLEVRCPAGTITAVLSGRRDGRHAGNNRTTLPAKASTWIRLSRLHSFIPGDGPGGSRLPAGWCGGARVRRPQESVGAAAGAVAGPPHSGVQGSSPQGHLRAAPPVAWSSRSGLTCRSGRGRIVPAERELSGVCCRSSGASRAAGCCPGATCRGLGRGGKEKGGAGGDQANGRHPGFWDRPGGGCGGQ
jgi:hypothetical protein